jgi:fucose permease
VANQYPLTLAIAVGMAKEKTNQASARITLAVGTALLLAPLLLGWLADRYGLQNAFGTIILLIVTALGIVIINTRFISKD